MKKLIYGAAMAAIALFSACENLAPVEAVDADSEKVILTATLGNDTKTYLEWNGSAFKTRWAEDDVFYLLDLKTGWDNSAEFELVSGAGESTARFEMTDGPMPENHVAVYGEIEHVEGNWFVGFDYNQYRCLYYNNGKEIQGFDAWTMPMIAEGNGENLYFKNLGSVLKLNIVGNGETLKSVIVRSRDAGVYLGGYALMNMEGNRPSYSFVEYEYEGDMIPMYDEIHFYPDVNDEPTVLSSDPVECYIVIPSQTYPSGLAIQLVTDSGYMDVVTVGSLVFSQSELREMPTLTYSATESFEGRWRIVDANSGDFDFLNVKEGDYYVLRNHYFEQWSNFSFYYEDDRYSWSEEMVNVLNVTNTCGKLQYCDSEVYVPEIQIYEPGYYDIYLNPYTLDAFIMSSGVSLSDIPTINFVWYRDYHNLYYIPDGGVVKIYGAVCALAQDVVLVKTSIWMEPILVFNRNLPELEIGDAVELYAIKCSYNNLPALCDVQWSRVYENSVDMFITNVYGTNITSQFDDISWNYYYEICFAGTLSVSGDSYCVTVDGAERQGLVLTAEDLSAYNGKKVFVSGYFAGISSMSSDEYLSVILSKISLPDTNGSTEDIIPDDDLVVSTR